MSRVEQQLTGGSHIAVTAWALTGRWRVGGDVYIASIYIIYIYIYYIYIYILLECIMYKRTLGQCTEPYAPRLISSLILREDGLGRKY